MPTEDQRFLIQQSLEQLRSKLPKVSGVFYRYLFEIDPSSEALFADNETAKQTKFINMLSTLARAKRLENLVPAMRQLGERHRDYGVTPFHFDSVRQALLQTLKEFLGDKLTQKHLQAWQDFFDAVGQYMQEGMKNSSRVNSTVKQKSQSYADNTLLEDIGDEQIITQVHERFYTWIFQDPWLGKFFWAKSKKVLVKHQTEFMVSCFGGGHCFTGETPAIAHMHMVITDEMYSLRQHHLRKAILAEGLSVQIADRWIAVDDAFRKAMIRSEPSQCVMRCLGQSPISSAKPDNYPWPLEEH